MDFLPQINKFGVKKKFFGVKKNLIGVRFNLFGVQLNLFPCLKGPKSPKNELNG